MSFHILIDGVPGSIPLAPNENNERIFSTSRMQVELAEMALPDPIHVHLFCGKMIWKTYTLHLEGSTPSPYPLETFKHYDNSFEHGMLEMDYQARRCFNDGLARKTTLLEIRIILTCGWCLDTSLVHAINQNTDKIVLAIECGSQQIFAWRPQYIYTDYTLSYRCYTWRENHDKIPLTLEEDAERIDDLRRITIERNGFVSPRKAKRDYIGDHDAIHNNLSVLPLETGPLMRRGLRFRFFNMRLNQNVEVVMNPREPRRRVSLCMHAHDSSSEDSESPPSDGTWWIKTRLHAHLSVSVRFAKPTTICEVRLEAYKYVQTLSNLMTEIAPRTV